MEAKMRIALAAVFFILAGAAFDTAKADPYRWCAQYMGGKLGGATNCYFVTLEQCRASVSGVGGYCRLNPFYDGVPVDGQPVKRAKKKRIS
jgi:hypothetical protein